MEQKTQQQLKQAKACFKALRLNEAYNILRRYFDRLPFKPEKEHAENIAMFARVLAELGKEYELRFYMSELERHYQALQSPEIAYQLGFVYCYISEPRYEAAKRIWEDLLRNPAAKPLHAKAKMMLAYYYDKVKDDIFTCRMIIESIELTEDHELNVLIEIWRAKNYKDFKNYTQAENILNELQAEITFTSDWYSYFYIRLNFAYLYLARQQKDKAIEILKEIKLNFEGKRFRTITIEIQQLEAQINVNLKMGSLTVADKEGSKLVTYQTQSILIRGNTPVEKLFLLLAGNKSVNKPLIIKYLYKRNYDAKQDDKLIYSHIHSLRKRLQSIGLPANTITVENEGYRLIPKVEFIGGKD